jgi:hypothetical protein
LDSLKIENGREPELVSLGKAKSMKESMIKIKKMEGEYKFIQMGIFI